MGELDRHREVWHYSDGVRVDGPAPARGREPLPGSGDERGFSIQLPKGYKAARRFTKDGRPCWNNKNEARELARRAHDLGDTGLHWDESGGHKAGI